MKVKICGITNFEDAKSAVDFGAEAIGFIFYKDSRRHISPNDAKNIIISLPFFVHKVGVFVNAEISYVNSVAKEIGLNAIQLHGNESLEYCTNITHPIIKAFRVDENFDYSKLDEFAGYQILLDAFSSKELGGTGINFNWKTIPSKIKSKIILAGGVSEDNIDAIYKDLKPQAVDLSSSLEMKPGIKDPQKLKSFFTKIKKLRNN